MGRERNKASQAGEMAGAQVQGWDCVQCDGEAMRSELWRKTGEQRGGVHRWGPVKVSLEGRAES